MSMPYPLIVALVAGLIAPAVAQSPSRADMLKPAPNPAWSAFSVKGYETEEIAADFYAFRYLGTRTFFLVTTAGVIVADPIEPKAAAILRDEIRKVTSQPVKFVVYSHEHWDHVPGAKIFKDEGAQVVAHENCAKHFKDLPHPDIVMPDITFSGSYQLKLGNHKIDLLYFGPNHGDCMVAMRPDVEGGKYLFIVDLMTPGGAPMAYMPDYSPHHWVRSLREIEALNVEVIVNGHGITLSHPSSISERRRYVEALMAAVKKAIDEGMSPNEIPEKVRLPEFAYMRGYDQYIRDNVRRIQTYYGIGW